MKTAFYPRLAWDGLRKNRRLAWPYLFTCVCMVAMHYILGFLSSGAVMSLLPRGRTITSSVLHLGMYVMLLFSLIFLFYTHSFLIRRRQKEFGLYNVLGMGKRNIARIVVWETLITAAIALAGGLLLGAALSKLAELALMNLISGTIDYRIRIDNESIGATIVSYALIFALNGVSAVIRTARGSAVSLMKAENVGEKPPKGNLLLAAAGLALLGAAYWMAVTITNPADALGWFFVAVLMVIAATYLLMIAGSVWLCRRLQTKRDFYYQPRHFVAVSSMAYRMKRNGAGLASICVIATMVLVMLSSVTCLWFGSEASISAQYPREINVTTHFNGLAQLADENIDILRSSLLSTAREHGGKLDRLIDQRYVNVTGALEDGVIQCDYEAVNRRVDAGHLYDIYLVSAADYAAATGVAFGLEEGEAALLLNRCDWSGDAITLAMGEATSAFHVVNAEKGSFINPKYTDSMQLSEITMIVPDLLSAASLFEAKGDASRGKYQLRWLFSFDTGLSDEANKALEYEMEVNLPNSLLADENLGFRGLYVQSRANGAAEFYDLNGGLMFLGVLLSLAFLMAAVLIIYYKQVSEGYEDARRFDIMQKVGMTKPEIRKSISSQLLMVFFLPLAAAGLHLAFAFPMIRRMMRLFSMDNMGLFVLTTLLSFGVFAAFYALVYHLTSGVYFRIVSGTGGEAQ
ncbi:MAG: FtsX-like permease family protein [Clostridia bacterium]|nr:FtsX-like permease family protein [Clostridia bacterium]